MIVVTLTYKKPLNEVDSFLSEHVQFLQDNYERKKFLASGRRENRVGGVILILGSSIREAKEIIKNDPFYIQEIADYDFLLFEPSKCLDEIKALV